MKKVLRSYFYLIILVFLCPLIARALPLLEVHFIDVGQGDAILVKCPSNQNVLIDTGNLSTGYRLGRYLKKQRVSSFKAIVITHMHPDHVGGLFSILPDLRVGKIFDNGAQLIGDDIWEEYINILKDLEIKREIFGEGDTFKLDDVIFELLSPSTPLTHDLNADSLVIKICYDRIKFFMTGDLNKKREKQLINKGFDIQSQVLKVGHHGACDATSEAFLDKNIMSVGENNRFGYPCPETLNRIKKKGIKLFRTDVDGTIVIRTDGEKISLKREWGK